MKESKFQSKLIRELKDRFPGCVVLKNDPNYIQGFPDLTVLYGSKWACLEVKRESKAKRRPNQEFYIRRLNKMSFAAFVSPENKEEVLDGLQLAWQPRRKARLPGGKQIPLDKL